MRGARAAVRVRTQPNLNSPTEHSRLQPSSSTPTSAPVRRVFDKAYYDRFYRNRKTSAVTAAELHAQATFICGYLNHLDVDSLILTGCSTSGCLRATAVDAFSYNFKVTIPEETTFDRFDASHAVNLFDLNCKYADVIATDEVAAYLEGLPAREALAAE